MEKENERRRRFFPQVSLGAVLAILTFAGSAVGVYTSLIQRVEAHSSDIQNLKNNEVKRENAEKDSRTEIKQEIRDVKGEVRDVNQKVDRILFELNKIPKPAAR